jgi:hypothetical protein
MTTARTSEGERVDIEDRPEWARSGLLPRAVGYSTRNTAARGMKGCHAEIAGP